VGGPVCAVWALLTRGSPGEFSNGWNDCGLYLHGVPDPGAPDQTTFPGDCAQWTAYESWGQDTKDGLNNFALASMDALQNWFFWTWKVRLLRLSFLPAR
jgi:glucan 1,3-beta-glucosidase